MFNGLLSGYDGNNFGGDPQRQALMTTALSLLGGREGFAKNLSNAGLAGMQAYQGAQQNQLLQKYREMQMQQMQSQMEEQDRERKLQEQVRNAATSSYQAVPQQLPVNEMEAANQAYTGDTGIKPAGFDQRAFIQKLYQIDPMQAMSMEQQLAKREAPIAVKEGESLLDPRTLQPVFQNKKAPDLPSAVREYEYAVQQGYKGSFNDWELSRRKAGATNVSLDARNYSTQENEQSKAYGKTLGEIRSTISNSAFRAPSTMAKLNRIEELLQGVDGGRLAPVGLEVSSAANSLGLKVDPNLGNKQAAEALARELAGELREPGTGPMTDKDFENFLQQVPSLSKTAEGRAQIIETSRRKLARDVEIGKLAREYARRNGGVVDDGFLDVVSDYVAQNPVIPRQSTSGRANVFPDMGAIEAELARRKGQR